MARRTYTKHVPDVRMITHYAESGSSVVHAMNPWTKATILFVIVALVTILTDIFLLLAVYAFTVAFYAAGRLPLRLLIGWYTMPLIFVVTLVMMFVFTEPGEEVAGLQLGSERIAVTDNGLLLMAKLVVRALAVVTFSLATFMTIRYQQVVYLAHRTMPTTLATMFLLTYRFLFVTSDELTNILDTMHSRNGSMVRGMTRQTRLFAGVLGHAFIHAFERAERISKAMESRGFEGRFLGIERVPSPGASGIAVICVSAAVLAAAFAHRYIGLGG